MRYNQLTYHKANPFYKQDFLPDRAWFNRKPKDFPSEIPTGQDYFTYSGRKHFQNRFNHSQIAEENILESPERFPFENRIALDKTYMRSLDTIDIEGAASGTRVNQSIKNKLRAKEELARRYNQSLDKSENKERTFEEKRRQIAMKQYETLQERKNKEKERAQMENSRVAQPNPTRKTQQNPQNYYQPYYQQTHNKYISLIPKPYQAHHQINNPRKQSQQSAIQQLRTQQNPHIYHQQSQPQVQPSHEHSLPTNNRHKSNPEYTLAYDAEWHRRREEYLKNQEVNELSLSRLQDKKEFRKYNPTNLSLNLAAQTIVGNR